MNVALLPGDAVFRKLGELLNTEEAQFWQSGQPWSAPLMEPFGWKIRKWLSPDLRVDELRRAGWKPAPTGEDRILGWEWSLRHPFGSGWARIGDLWVATGGFETRPYKGRPGIELEGWRQFLNWCPA